jgi:hypothetical protein
MDYILRFTRKSKLTLYEVSSCSTEIDQFKKNEKMIKSKCKVCGPIDTQIITDAKDSI